MPDQAPPIRTFIAIELPEAIKRALLELQQRLWVEPAAGIKWVAPESIHLTLKFLGWVVPARVEDIKSAISESAAGLKPFKLGLSGLGAFPNPRRMNVIWCGLSGDVPRLEALQQSTEKNVSPLGFPTESRAFSPHLTLARLREEVSLEVKQKLADKLNKTKFEPDLTIPVNSVSLMRSTLLPTGAVYICLGRFPLAVS